jgi:phosphate transport system substrate-binding protein
VSSTLITFLFSLFSFDGQTSEKLIIDGSTGVKPLIESLVKHYKQTQPNTSVEIGAGLNPQRRIQALVDEDINIAMASHGVDIQRISQLGLKAHRIAKMAVVIGVNHTVSISTISDEQLCDIYSGKINNWHHLEGAKLPIIPLLRPFNEVDTEVVSTHVPCFSQVQFSADIQAYKKSGQMANAIRQTPGAVGMTTLVRVAQSNDKIRALSINGISSDSENLLSGAYPLTRDSFLITQSEPTREVSAFLAFIRSEQGSAIILANSAVPAE